MAWCVGAGCISPRIGSDVLWWLFDYLLVDIRVIGNFKTLYMLVSKVQIFMGDLFSFFFFPSIVERKVPLLWGHFVFLIVERKAPLLWSIVMVTSIDVFEWVACVFVWSRRLL